MAIALAALVLADVLTDTTAPSMGKFNRYDATSADLLVSLPALSGLNVGARCAVQKYTGDLSGNTVTFACAGTDTFDDAATVSFTLDRPGAQQEIQVVSLSNTKYWKTITTAVSVSEPPLSLKTYAVGDGTANDTDAIDAALAALPPGGELYIPPGRYMTDGGHTITTDNVTIAGSSGRSDPYYNGAVLYLRAAANADLFTLDGAVGVTIRDLSLYGNASNQSGTSRGIVTHSSNACNYFLFDAVWVGDCNGDGFVIDGPAGLSGTLTNCEARLCTGYGMRFTVSDILLADSYIDQNTQSGLMLEGGAIQIVNCHLWGNGTAHADYCDGITLWNNVDAQISNTYVESNYDAGIRLKSTNDGTIITGSRIRNNGAQGIYAYNSANCTITANGIDYNNANDIGAQGAGIIVVGCNGWTIVGNQFYGGRQEYGYYEYSTGNTDMKFFGNMCRAADQATGAILLEGTGTGTDLSVVGVPASAAAAGVPNQVAYDATHFYVCVAADTWVRATLASWA